MSGNGSLFAMERGVPQGIFGGLLGMFFTGLMQFRGMVPDGPFVLLLGGIGFGLLSWAINYAVIQGSGSVAGTVHMPSGDTTAYVPTFSHIEALEIRGDLEGAATAWADACATHAGNALVHVKAADFHLRLRQDAATALALYRTVRDMPTAGREHVRYAQAKIVDLYLGPLEDEGRALVELRRLIDGFPGTREAEMAREALAKLKESRRER